jgi:hypothetical protein
MQLINRVRTAFSVPLPIRAIFECPTVAELAPRTEEEVARQIEEMTPEQIEAALQASANGDWQTEKEVGAKELMHG